MDCQWLPSWPDMILGLPFSLVLTIKLLEENIGRTLDDIKQSKILCDPPPRVTQIKTKVNKWDLIKLKSFCTAKEIISTVKRQSSEREKNNSK